MGFLRWKGLAAFIIITSLIFAVWFLLIDRAIKEVIEVGGTKVVGAKVDLQKANLSLSPLGLTLLNLDVTDPDSPMTNMIHIDRIAFLMDFGSLLLGKVIVNEMTIDGIETKTVRNKSGALKKIKGGKTKKAEKSLVNKSRAKLSSSLKIQNTKKILETEELETVVRINKFDKFLKTKNKEWQKRIEGLPDDKKIKEYDKRFKEIKKGLKGNLKKVLKALDRAKRLQKDIDKELKSIKKASKDLKKDLKKIKREIKEIEGLPKKDLKRLKNKYSLSPGGLSNLSRLLFGKKIDSLMNSSLYWYEKVRPYMERATRKDEADKKPLRSKGTDIKFREFNPRPDFLVKKSRLTLKIPAGQMKGEIRNITDSQVLTGVPISFAFSGTGLKGMESVTLDGEIRRTDPLLPVEKAILKISAYDVKDVVLSDSGDFPVTLEKAQTDIGVTFNHKEGNFDAIFNARYNDVLFSTVTKDSSSTLTLALASALSDVKSFNLKGKVSGKNDGYKLKLSSDLDKVLKEAVGKMIKKESARFVRDLKKAINSEVEAPFRKLKAEAAKLGGNDKKLSSKLKALKAQLKNSKKLKPKGIKLPF